MKLNLATAQRENIETLPREALHILELLEQIENHTINLRKDILSEMTADQSSIKLILDQV